MRISFRIDDEDQIKKSTPKLRSYLNLGKISAWGMAAVSISPQDILLLEFLELLESSEISLKSIFLSMSASNEIRRCESSPSSKFR